METLGDLIKSYRLKKGLTTTQLAEKIEVSQGYISHLENNRKKNPSSEIIKKVASALDIPLGELLISAGYIDEFKDMLEENLNKPFPIPTFGEAIEDARDDWVDENDISYTVSLEKISAETGIALKVLEDLEQNKGIELISIDELFKLSKALDVIFAYLFLIRERDLGDSILSESETDNLIRSLHALSYSEMTFISNNTFEKYLEKQVELNKKYNPDNTHDENFWLSIYERYKYTEKINNLVVSRAFSKLWNETKDIRYLINNDFLELHYKGKKLSFKDKEKIIEVIQNLETEFEYED